MNTDDIEAPVKCSDESDRASLIEQAHIEECINQNKWRREQAPRHFDGVHCIDCDEAIHEKRLAHGFFRCITDQELVEKRAKLRRKG